MSTGTKRPALSWVWTALAIAGLACLLAAVLGAGSEI
jgi:hypothetical protein